MRQIQIMESKKMNENLQMLWENYNQNGFQHHQIHNKNQRHLQQVKQSQITANKYYSAFVDVVVINIKF